MGALDALRDLSETVARPVCRRPTDGSGRICLAGRNTYELGPCARPSSTLGPYLRCPSKISPWPGSVYPVYTAGLISLIESHGLSLTPHLYAQCRRHTGLWLVSPLPTSTANVEEFTISSSTETAVSIAGSRTVSTFNRLCMNSGALLHALAAAS